MYFTRSRDHRDTLVVIYRSYNGSAKPTEYGASFVMWVIHQQVASLFVDVSSCDVLPYENGYLTLLWWSELRDRKNHQSL